MALSYSKFNSMGLDLAPLGIYAGGERVSYFCTPRGAGIFADAGIDGIHLCFVRGFGEMVFAVSPENLPGDYVHPIARNFEDLLRLLLACGHLAAMEQAHKWDRPAFDAYLKEQSHLPEQEATLQTLASVCHLSPMEDPFGYIKQVQSAFDYSKIKYTAEYRDHVGSLCESEPPTPGQVFYEGGWSQTGKGKPGIEMPIGAQFSWGEELWHIPAVYVCGKGFVVDLCIEVEPARVRAYLETWQNAVCLTPAEEQTREEENPLCVEFGTSFVLNGRVLKEKSGVGTAYVPRDVLPEGEENPRDAVALVEHYALDVRCAWVFRRISIPWATARAPKELSALSIRLTRDPKTILGPRIADPAIGEVITLTHPTNGEVYHLTVLACERGRLAERAASHEGYDLPPHYVSLTYTVDPEPKRGTFTLRDCASQDAPRYVGERVGDGCSTIAVIGAIDGPVALFSGVPQGTSQHTVLSSLHHEPAARVEWQTEFRVKTVEDIEIELIARKNS